MRIIGGTYRGKKLSFSPLPEVRPTSDRVREMVFNVLFHNPRLGTSVLRGQPILDVFAGTGAFGLEAFSRGASSVTFIENNKKVLPFLRTNVQALQLSPSCILEQNLLALGKSPSPFPVVFLDPPYKQDLLKPALTQLLEKGWLAPKAHLIVETEKDESVVWPSFISPLFERTEGRAKITFCILLPSSLPSC